MIHPDTELRYISPTIGYGVVAKKLIPKGTITWVQDDLDRIFTAAEEARLSPQLQEYLETYCFANHKGEKILCWDHAKYVNHSFRPSCMSTAYDFEIAIRDIQPGEQLTDDYGYLNIAAPFEPEDEGTPRKTVYPDDLLHYHQIWDQAILQNLENIQKVAQPLEIFLSEKNRLEFREVLDKKAPLRSLLECYYPRQQ